MNVFYTYINKKASVVNGDVILQVLTKIQISALGRISFVLIVHFSQ